MDPFDEFEMKPLTEGLGFHKKALKINKEAKESNLASPLALQEIPRSMPSSLPETPASYQDDKKTLEKIMAALDTPVNRKLSSQMVEDSSVKITSTLPRPEDAKKMNAMEVDIAPKEMPSIWPTQDLPPSKPIVKNIPAAAYVGTRRGAADAPQLERWKTAPVAITSALLDAVVVVALSLVFLVSLLLVTKINLMLVVGNAREDLTTQLSFAMLFLAVMQMYVVVSRSFFGKTLGEWTFDFQMGDAEQIKKGYYPLLVLWRSVVIVLTGVIVLPLLSFITRLDLASYLTGLQLYRRV